MKNMLMLYVRGMDKLEEKLENSLQFAAKKNKKLKTKKFVIGSQVEFGGSVLTVEKLKNQELIFITPKGEKIRAFEELRNPQNKKDCQVFSGMLSSLSKWNPTVSLEIPLIRKATADKGKFVWTDKID